VTNAATQDQSLITMVRAMMGFHTTRVGW